MANYRKGLCSCGRPRLEGKSRCEACQEKRAPWRQSRAERLASQGLCRNCESAPPEPHRACCRACLDILTDANNEKRRQRLEQGLCNRCGKRPHLSDNTVCRVCFFKLQSQYTLHTTKQYKALEDLFDRQGGRCAYSGVPLTIGKDAELDHRVARSSGGSDDISNLQWCHQMVNQIKFNYSEADFLAMVVRIYQHCNLGATTSF